MPFAMVNVPAGTRTTWLYPAEARAALILDAVTVPPNNVIHADVTHGVLRSVLCGAPAKDQVMARDGAIIPVQRSWPHTAEHNANSRSNFRIS